jgi:hypothetical protein
MARRVFLHIGLPKTGTSYLQSILWGNRASLERLGVLLPGAERRDHLWASCVVRGDPRTERRNRLAPGSWDRLVSQAAAWGQDVVISHEFFSSASADQAAAAVRRLAPAEVHVVVTARDTLDLFTSSWQEYVKNKGTVPIDRYCAEVSPDPLEVWNWRALDLGLVLERWTTTVPADRVHVLPLSRPGSEPDDLWDRFATLVGIAPDSVDVSHGFPNRSMGVVETETLRRINATLDGFDRPYDRGVWIRTYLADERLVPRGGERFWPSPAQVDDCRRRGQRAVDLVGERGFDVRGRLEDLVTPQTLPPRRHPGSVSEAEVAEVAVALVGRFLTDVRALTDRLARPTPAPPPTDARRVIRQVGRALGGRRSGTAG